MTQPKHMTIEQAAKYLRYEISEVKRLIEKGELTPQEEGIPFEQVRHIEVLDILISKPMSIDHVEGKGETRQPLVEDLCTDCQQRGGVVYVGSDVLDGSLEYYHLVHTEVRNYFECTLCQSAWNQFQFL